MAQPHLYRTEAVILRRLDYGEADRILTLFTARRGKIRALAKGVRRPTSRIGGHLELFTHSQLLLARGRNLDIVTQAETIHAYLDLRSDLVRASAACTAIELLDRLTPDELEHRAAFDLIVTTLDRIATARRPDAPARYFTMQLLGLLGYRPELRECVRCRATLGPIGNLFNARAGGMVCPSCARTEPAGQALSPNAFKVLRLLQSPDYATVSRLRLEPGLQLEVEQTLRAYVQFVLEGDLRSTAFADQVRAATRQ